MAVSTDRFRVTSIRPEAHLHTDQVPEDLREKMLDQIITVDDLEGMGAPVKASRLYHGGGSLVVVYWHGEEYVLYLEPAA